MRLTLRGPTRSMTHAVDSHPRVRQDQVPAYPGLTCRSVLCKASCRDRPIERVVSKAFVVDVISGSCKPRSTVTGLIIRFRLWGRRRFDANTATR
jgi:hypothetical protein